MGWAEGFAPRPSGPISAGDSISIFKARAGSAKTKSATTTAVGTAARGNKILPSPVYKVCPGSLMDRAPCRRRGRSGFESPPGHPAGRLPSNVGPSCPVDKGSRGWYTALVVGGVLRATGAVSVVEAAPEIPAPPFCRGLNFERPAAPPLSTRASEAWRARLGGRRP